MRRRGLRAAARAGCIALSRVCLSGRRASITRRKSSCGPPRSRCSTTNEKAGRSGFVLSISGGADSAAAACLVALTVERALGELGGQRFADKLGLTPRPSARDWVHELLCCAYQPTDNSGEVTRHAATAVAEALGATFYVLDVQHIVEAYESLISEAIGRSLDLGARTTSRCRTSRRESAGRACGCWPTSRGAAVGHEQPLRGGRRLRHDGRRHLRRPEPHRRDRQGLSSPLAAVAGDRGPDGRASDPRPGRGQRPGPDCRAPPAGAGADRRRRPDALRGARCRSSGRRSATSRRPAECSRLGAVAVPRLRRR